MAAAPGHGTPWQEIASIRIELKEPERQLADTGGGTDQVTLMGERLRRFDAIERQHRSEIGVRIGVQCQNAPPQGHERARQRAGHGRLADAALADDRDAERFRRGGWRRAATRCAGEMAMRQRMLHLGRRRSRITLFGGWGLAHGLVLQWMAHGVRGWIVSTPALAWDQSRRSQAR